MAATIVKAEISGIVMIIEKKSGDPVEVDETILVLESMKMEIPLVATAAGIVEKIWVAQGEMVNEGQPVCTIAQ